MYDLGWEIQLRTQNEKTVINFRHSSCGENSKRGAAEETNYFHLAHFCNGYEEWTGGGL